MVGGSFWNLHAKDWTLTRSWMHVHSVTLDYHGVRLTEMIRDTVTGASFSHSYSVDIRALLGGNVGNVGFTAGTGGNTTVADIQTWTYQFASDAPLAPRSVGLQPAEDLLPITGQPSAPSQAASILAIGTAVGAEPFTRNPLSGSPSTSLTVVPDNKPVTAAPSVPMPISADADTAQSVRVTPDTQREVADQLFASADRDQLWNN